MLNLRQVNQEIETEQRDKIIELTHEYMDLCLQYMRLGYDRVFPDKKDFMEFVMNIWLNQKR